MILFYRTLWSLLVPVILLCASTAVATPRVLNEIVRVNWITGGDRCWYERELPEAGVEFILVDAVAGTRGPAFDHSRVAEALASATGDTVTATHLPVEFLVFADDGGTVELQGARSWNLDLSTYELDEVAGGAGNEGIPFDRNLRPSGGGGPETWVTFINRWTDTVLLFWIDGSGGRHQYGELAPGQRHRQHTFATHVWAAITAEGRILAVFDAPAEEALAIIDGGEPTRTAPAPVDMGPGGVAVPSPDGQLAVFVRDHDLWLRDLATGVEIALSHDGSPGDSYRQDTQRARLVEMEYNRAAAPDSMPTVFWSPDSRFVVALKTRAVKEREVTMVASAPADRLQPRVETYPYLKPGDAIPVGIPHLFDTKSARPVALDATLFAEPWDIYDYHWAPDGSRCFFLYNQRGHQIMRVLAVEAATGEVTAVVNEECATFFDYQGKTFLEHLDDRDRLIWMSERDGWNHLYLYDRTRGKVKKQLTKGDWVVRDVEKVDAENGTILLRAMGLVPDQDPYQIHLARVDLDGKNLTVLTEGDGTHRVRWSPDDRFFVDTWSRVDLPPVHVLRAGATGAEICRLETADATAVTVGGRTFPERITAKGRDGETDIYGIIHRPLDFDPDRTYPVIESIYAGPHGHHVPKGFRARYRQQELADLGFVVVQIDGMGTNWRSKAFHDVCWQNILDAGFPDRIAWIEAAAARYPFMDVSRVGIYGGSAGGQNALAALLTHGDFYQAAMADCGCHDNRMDKIWWNEQWMGFPIGPHYTEQSNVTLAPDLEGDLLLIVGELDRNVDPASTMQVVDALVKADKDFEMLVLPGVGHGAAGTEYGWRRTREFFVRSLRPGDAE